MKPTDCTCREVLQDNVLRRVSHPYYRCPFYGTYTPLSDEEE